MTRERRPVRLYRRHTLAELTAMMMQTDIDHPPRPGVHYDGCYIYPRKVRMLRDDIAQAIAWHLRDVREVTR